MIEQGDVWWADLPQPLGSVAGYRRPIVVVQGDSFNQSRISTVLSVPLTGNAKWSGLPGNVLLPAASTGLDRDSIANASLVLAVDKAQLIERVGRLDHRHLARVLAGIDKVLGR